MYYIITVTVKMNTFSLFHHIHILFFRGGRGGPGMRGRGMGRGGPGMGRGGRGCK